MLITTIEELRLASPAHALETIDGLAGFIDNSEHEFLKDKLGTPLYDALCTWYADNPTHTNVIDTNTEYYNRLLLLAQRCIAFDALGRSIGMQIVSVHNSGVNVPTAEDYDKPKKEDIDTYRSTCNQEAHAALNRLLAALEAWTQEVALSGAATDSSSSSSSDESTEKEEIVTLWRQSRYFYLAAQLLIPSAVVLQQYLNFYESREKFIQMLPDLQFIQEEIITPAIGDAFTAMLVDFAVDATVPDGSPSGIEALLTNTLHRLRKVMAALLVGRTSVLRYSKEEKIRHHDDGVRMFQTTCDYIRNHQNGYPEDIIKASPLYVDPEPEAEVTPTTRPACGCTSTPASVPSDSSEGPSPNDPACWVPPLF